MTEAELWNRLVNISIAQNKPFDRLFVWIKKEDFESVKKYFITETNIIHKGASYRTRSLFKHIHAVEQDDVIFIHQDTGNIAMFFPLGLLHLIFDVIPYLAFALFKRKSLHTLFEKP